MSRFLETICIRDGHPMHLEWHQRRVDATLKHFYPESTNELQTLPLSEILSSCEIPEVGTYRCRVVYDLNAVSIEFLSFEFRDIKSLKLLEVPRHFDYRYKFADRRSLESLYDQRGEADDILILRNGWVTDTSIANIAFRKGPRWYTPSLPLLAGTTWKRLISHGILIPRPIHKTDIRYFDSFRVINAMHDWEEVEKNIDFILSD